MRSNFELLLLFLTISITLHAQDAPFASLNIDDPAPPLRVSEWIKGTPVQQFEKGRVYVIEFWATWCRPCLAYMPDLSVLAREYKGKVTVIAIDIYESKVKPVKSAKKVKAFVDSMGKRMDFNVAIEDSNFTVADWIEATGEQNNGIPKTFVIDENGRLAWIGHPSKLEEVLPKVVYGTWDIKEELARRNENKRLAILDDSLHYELARFERNPYNTNDIDKPDSALLMIDEIVRKEPGLKYAPWIATHTFYALLKTDTHKAYEYGKKEIVTPGYDSVRADVIINGIELYPDKSNLPSEIYELGAEAYQVEINQIRHPAIVNTPRLYSNMSEMYWLAKNKSKAIETIQKAIEELKSRKDFSKKDMASFESKLQQYQTM